MIIAIQRRVSRALPIMLYSRRLTSTLELSSHVSHSLVIVATFKSASLIRSCTAETCFPLANKDVFFFLCLLWYLHSCTALWTLGENGSSSMSMSRRTDSTGESSFSTSRRSFFYSAPLLLSEVLFTQECRNCCLCSVRLSKWYWWLGTRCVTDWWCCWNSAHFAPLDTIRQRLISFRSTLCIQHPRTCRIALHPSHAPCSYQAHCT